MPVHNPLETNLSCMPIANFEKYHGPVLAQIVRSPKINLKLLERREGYEWGVYEVIDNQAVHRIFVKYREQVRSGIKGKKSCTFIFPESDIKHLREIDSTKNLLICLVCGDQEICVLEWSEIDNSRLLLEKTAASVTVSWITGSSLHIRCRNKKLGSSIPRNRLKEYNWS